MASPTPVGPPRVASIDAYRGFVMFLMLAEVFRLSTVAKSFPGNEVWKFLGEQQSHVEWRGCSLHDLIQPSFSFLVGAALAFSVANRQARSQPKWLLLGHAALRSLILIALGIFLRSVNRKQTNFTFEDTLTQIGLGYFPLVLLSLTKPVWQWVGVVVLLVGYWLAFALYLAPGPDFPFAENGVKPEWRQEHSPTGFASHWDKNSNAAWAFDQWFLNLFKREKPFVYNGGGYATLSFLPTLATMLFGLIAGNWLRAGPRSWQTVGLLVGVGLVCLSLGYGLDWIGLCPNVKRIWTPSWAIFSAGWCSLFLAGFASVCDVLGWVGWSYPLRVIGANSIVAYCSEHLIGSFLVESTKVHFGRDVFEWFGKEYAPLFTGAVVFAILWLILFWLYRKRIFIRI
jgi:predicted acyltransferase